MKQIIVKCVECEAIVYEGFDRRWLDFVPVCEVCTKELERAAEIDRSMDYGD